MFEDGKEFTDLEVVIYRGRQGLLYDGREVELGKCRGEKDPIGFEFEALIDPAFSVPTQCRIISKARNNLRTSHPYPSQNIWVVFGWRSSKRDRLPS